MQSVSWMLPLFDQFAQLQPATKVSPPSYALFGAKELSSLKRREGYSVDILFWVISIPWRPNCFVGEQTEGFQIFFFNLVIPSSLSPKTKQQKATNGLFGGWCWYRCQIKHRTLGQEAFRLNTEYIFLVLSLPKYLTGRNYTLKKSFVHLKFKLTKCAAFLFAKSGHP